MIYEKHKIIKMKKIISFFLIFFISSVGMQAQAHEKGGDPIIITEYADFQCSDCADASNIVDQVIRKYNGQVILRLKQLPLEFHKGALPAAKCFEALYRRNPARAWQFYAFAFDEQAVLEQGDAGISCLINKLGLNPREREQLAADIADPSILDKINADIAEADAQGIDEVPTFFINNIKMEECDTPESFYEIIDHILAQQK